MVRSAWRHLGRYLHRPAPRVGLLAALSFVGGVAEAAVFVLVVATSARVVGDRVGTGLLSSLPEVSTATMLLIAAGFALVVMLLHWWTAALTASMATEVQVAVQHRMVDAYLGATWTTQSGQSSGLFQESVTVQAGQAAMYAVSVLAGAGSILHTSVLVATALIVDPLLALAVVVSGALLVGVLRPFARHLTEWSTGNVRATAGLATEVTRAARMAMELRAFGAGPAVAGHLRGVAADVGVRSERIRRLARFSRSIYRDLAMLLLVGAVYVMSSVAELDMVAFGSVVLLVVRAVNGAQSVYEAAVHCRELEPNLAEIGRRLAALETSAEPDGHLELERIDSIDAHDVGYAYVPGEWALRHLHLCLQAGEVVGVVGHSGGGKSTLVQLLTRLRRPTEGAITVNGVPYGEVTETSWTSLVALVPQEPDLMEATVADNIAFWRTGLSRDRIEEAARLAHVYDDIVQLPSGFDTMLGPDGQGLSGGQKQRVAIARALVARPSLLVLDEPTSALDATTESLIRDTIRSLRGSVIVVVVAHRPSTLEVCDRIVTIESGSIVSDVRNVGHG